MQDIFALLGIKKAFVLSFTYITDDPAGKYWDVTTTPHNAEVESDAREHLFEFVSTDPNKSAHYTLTVEPRRVFSGVNVKTSEDNVVALNPEVKRELHELVTQAYNKLQALNGPVERLLNGDILNVEVQRAAIFFVRNPELLATADKVVKVELVPTYICPGCGIDHVRQDYESPNSTSDQNPFIRLLSSSSNLLPPELKRLVGQRNTAPKMTFMMLGDRNGTIASSAYATAIVQAIVTMMVPRIREAIPTVITQSEERLVDALQQVTKYAADSQKKRAALAAAGIDLPEEMSPAIAALLPQTTAPRTSTGDHTSAEQPS